jgi:hypothetical protein
MILRILPILAALFFLVGCANDPRTYRGTLYLTDTGGVVAVPQRARANFDNVSYWDGDGVQGSPFILIRLSEQRAYFYKGKQLVGVSAISTGREGWDTPTGKFKVLQKNKDHVSSIYGDYVDAVTGEPIQKDIDRRIDKMPKGAKYDGAKMPYFIRITGGVGMHTGFLPGYAASHGCIRMPDFMAAAFFNNVDLKTPVEIVP